MSSIGTFTLLLLLLLLLLFAPDTRASLYPLKRMGAKVHKEQKVLSLVVDNQLLLEPLLASELDHQSWTKEDTVAIGRKWGVRKREREREREL